MSFYREALEKIKPYKPGKPIEEVKRDLGLKRVFKLASNECVFEPVYISRAVKKEVKNINRYPESGCYYLRKRLAEKLNVEGSRIVFGNGSDEIITLSIKAFVDKGDRVTVSCPTFLIYEIQAGIAGAEIVKVPLKDYRYDLGAILSTITPETKIVFIANPDNPTGNYINDKDLRNFLNSVPDSVIVYLDEAYFEFAPPDFPRSLDYLKERKNIIVSRTFSKVYGLAGCRVGYGITTPEIAACLDKVREPFNINRFAQVCALSALNNPAFLKKVLSYTLKEKKYFYRELGNLGLKYIESATNFIMVDFGRDTSGLYRYLLERGVIVRELKGWGLDNCIRVTVGRKRENRFFIKFLKEYLKR